MDGQNLYHAARKAFGYSYPNYDAQALASAICARQGWSLVQTRFYTGLHDASENSFWHHFWTAKLAVMRGQGVEVYTRPLEQLDGGAALAGLGLAAGGQRLDDAERRLDRLVAQRSGQGAGEVRERHDRLVGGAAPSIAPACIG